MSSKPFGGQHHHCLGREPKGHLLPCCSHTILKHRQKRGTKNYQKGTKICSSFWAFLARSEGYLQGLEAAHNPKVAGSNPALAMNQRTFERCFRRLHVLVASP